MNASKTELKNASIYQAAADWYRQSASLENNRKGHLVSPDEILSKHMNITEIPIYERDQLMRKGIELPDSDLLNALHYYTSNRIHRSIGRLSQEDRRTSQILDETALLAMGAAVETWIDSLISARVDSFQQEIDGQESEGDEEEEEEEDTGSEEGENDENDVDNNEDDTTGNDSLSSSDDNAMVEAEISDPSSGSEYR
ncbi:unnamed protein product [Kuraishia capsulata CBS 1993]|uniref:Uncharacterized protein n=1 Tax=Kuraishia capsulata CBS 1993 TaxID=1382522 RepID=W6MS01_9ASCO|nr:uncharacterized protein KUCA_T00005533001 [Kuraishia capsulata CBS 1993]CDK29541.1 unnamed protein product [Kuraishia capsulata CBS 1993]